MLLSVILIFVVLFFTFLIFKTKNNKKAKLIIYSLCIIFFTLNILLPCTETLPSTLYVTNVENGINVTLREGLKYAHFNCGASDSDTYINSLPKAKCEKLDFLYISKSNKTTNDVTKQLIPYKPQTTVITEFAKGNINETNIELPKNTIISNSYTHKFNNEITIQIVDTYPASCVIIKTRKKIVLVSYGDNSDLDTVFETYGKPDILILSEDLPKAIPEDIDTLVISCDSDIIVNKNLATIKSQTKNFHATAENGGIKIIL